MECEPAGYRGPKSRLNFVSFEVLSVIGDCAVLEVGRPVAELAHQKLDDDGWRRDVMSQAAPGQIATRFRT